MQPRYKTLIKHLFWEFRACLHEGGGPRIGEVTCGGSPHLSCKCHQLKMRDYMDRRVTWVTSTTWVLHLHVNRSLNCFHFHFNAVGLKVLNLYTAFHQERIILILLIHKVSRQYLREEKALQNMNFSSSQTKLRWF